MPWVLPTEIFNLYWACLFLSGKGRLFAKEAALLE